MLRWLLPLLVLLLGAPAGAASWRSCGGQWRCTRLQVPLDWQHPQRGRIPLQVRWWHPSGDARPVVLALSGGPGQPGLPFAEQFQENLQPLLSDHDLVVWDPRGTGRSGVLNCPQLQRDPLLTPSRLRRCWQDLRGRGAFYDTEQNLGDIEALRRAVRAPRITLFGVSYGTLVAARYAARYPQRTDALILDSPVDPFANNRFENLSLRSSTRVVSDLCAAGRCPFTADVADDWQTVVRAAAGRGLLSHLRRPGVVRPYRLTQERLFYLLLATSLDGKARAQLPGALADARRDDTAPLARLARRAERDLGAAVDLKDLSAGAYVASSCSDSIGLWPTRSSWAQRTRLLRRAWRALPAEQWGPFAPRSGWNLGLGNACRGWPASRPLSRAPTPLELPVLVLSGDVDALTPRETFQGLQRVFPRAQLARIPDSGHDTLDSEQSPCAQGQLEDFLAGTALRSCTPLPAEDVILPPLPRRWQEAAAAAAAPAALERQVGALQQSLQELERELEWNLAGFMQPRQLRLAGLRGGWLELRGNQSWAVVLHRYRPIDGVVLQGRITSDGLAGRVRISGSVGQGWMELWGDQLRGQLNGETWSVPEPRLSSYRPAARWAAAPVSLAAAFQAAPVGS